MTAGIAVKFRKQFNRLLNYLASKLTTQTSTDGATIYGLVTKEMFYGNPLPEDYVITLKQFTKNFTCNTLFVPLWVVSGS